jgi:TnpA family transposase
VSDQHSTYDTKVIVATAPESHYVLDGILGNETDLPIAEHATDTHGATLANFAHCSTWLASNSRRGSATSARSLCIGSGRRSTSRTAIRGSGRCLPAGSTPT